MTSPHHAPPGAFAALLAQAERQPQAEALRCKRHGAWRVHSWSRLADDVRAAAQGWAALGVRSGDTIAVLGPLGAPFFLTLSAADALGANVAVALPDEEAALTRGSRFACVDGSHELERLLRRGGPRLEAVVVGDGAGTADAVSFARVVTDFAGLFERGRDATLPRAVPAGVTTGAGVDHARVLADFDPTWRPGVDFVARDWAASGALLLVPEPGGDAMADRREARASLWLAPADRLAAFERQFADRAPSTGLAAWAVRAARSDGRRPIGSMLRSRLVANLGLDAVREVRSDAGLPDPTHALLTSLGVSVKPHTETLAHAVSHLAAPTPQRYDNALAVSTS